MVLDPFQAISLGRTDTSVTRLGFGCAPIGGLYEPADEVAALATLEHAWTIGIRYFDVAPMYGSGTAERLLGAALHNRPRDEYTLSTKVGRLVDPDQPGSSMLAPSRLRFDFSPDGTMRSIEASLKRLDMDRVDIAFVHDPDDHWEDAIRGAYPVLARLRDEGVLGAIGVGMNQTGLLTRFAREGDFDVFLVAGRYTLLDQSALKELLPTCAEKGIAVVVGGVMNSGLLADPRPGAMYDYAPADSQRIATAQRIKAICDGYDVPLKAAAMQLPLAHPAVVSVLAGVRSIDHLDDYPRLLRFPIPPGLWSDLLADGLIADGTPLPVPGP